MVAPNTGKAKILIVEDDSFSQTILNMFLSRNYDTDVVENGVEAIELLQDKALPQLIISDLNTPEMNGLELLQYLKENPLYNAIPFVILCGEDSLQLKQLCLQYGASAFVLKPFNPVELSALINNLLAK
jgi:CheY-like chemotaxis protein